MPSLARDSARHVVIDQRAGHYLCFPDVCLGDAGRLVCVYREGDQHVATRSRLLARTSDDLGATWSGGHVLLEDGGHCPRITRLPGSRLAGSRLLVIDDHSQSLYESTDNADSFRRIQCRGAYIPLPDRIMPLPDGTLLTTGHTHRGEHSRPTIGQAPSEQMTFLSRDGGVKWRSHSVLAYDPRLVLCEGSMTALADGTLLALMRENSFVHEPMYACRSTDNGATWSDPRPTPLIGHRPCLGLTPGGRLLVTYRNVGPDGGTAAWLGDLEELETDFRVHGLHPAPDNPRPTPEGLLISNDEGPDRCVRYALRPITDPEASRAELDVEVLAHHGQDNACGVHFCGWWRITPSALLPPGDAQPLPLEPGRPVRLGLRYAPGRVSALLDGQPVLSLDAPAARIANRPILIGHASLSRGNGGSQLWRALSLSISEPRYLRDYAWRWDHAQGHPDAWARARVLELANDRHARFGDYGYSGWAALPDGRYFCAFHHGGGDAPDYDPGRSSHVRGAWIEESDFTPTP